MSSRNLGPFPGLAGLPDVDSNKTDDDGILDILERCDLVNAVLAAQGCNCNGHAAGHQRDEYWGADLSELVCRCTSHDVNTEDDDGNPITVSMSLKIESLRVVVDDNNEIMFWMYDES
jgi:hypothetical protein